jgi:hypothetical protein
VGKIFSGVYHRMFDCNWLRKFTPGFVGVLALVALAAFCITFLSLRVGQVEPSEQHGKWQAGGEHYQDADTPAALLAQKACAEADEVGPSDTEQHNKRDLCAQFQSAAAAEKSANFASWQTYLGVGGFVAVMITLLLNIRATNAAVDANVQNERQARQELRAYILLDSFGLDIVAVEGINDGKADFNVDSRVVLKNFRPDGC